MDRKICPGWQRQECKEAPRGVCVSEQRKCNAHVRVQFVLCEYMIDSLATNQGRKARPGLVFCIPSLNTPPRKAIIPVGKDYIGNEK